MNDPTEILTDDEMTNAIAQAGAAAKRQQAALADSLSRKYRMPYTDLMQQTDTDLKRMSDEDAYREALSSGWSEMMRGVYASDPAMAHLMTVDDIKAMNGIRGHVANISESWRRSKMQEELAGLSGRVVFKGEDDLASDEKLRLDDLRKQLAKPYNSGDQFGRDTTSQIVQSGYSSIKGMAMSVVGGIAGGLAGSEIPILGNIAGAAIGAGAASYGYSATQEAGNAYEEYLGYLKANGIDTPEAVADAANRSAAAGRINGAIEFLPGLSIAKNIPGLKHIIAKAALKEGAEAAGKKTIGQSLKTAAKNVGETMLFEGGTEGMQEAVTMGLSPEQFTARQYLERVGEAAKIGALMGGGMGLPGPVMQVAMDYHDIKQARAENKQVRDLIGVVQKTDLAQGAPDKMADALRIMGHSGDVTIDAKGMATLLTDDHLQKIEASSPGFTAQLKEAAGSGDTFTMPKADFVAKVGSIVGQDAADHITLNQSAVLTASQAMEREKWLASPELAAKLDMAFKTVDGPNPEFTASTERVYQHELTKQQAVYGDTPAAKAHAKLVGSFISSMAHLSGMTPEEFYAGGKGKSIPYKLVDQRNSSSTQEGSTTYNATTKPENLGQVAPDATKETAKAGQVVTHETPSGDSTQFKQGQRVFYRESPRHKKLKFGSIHSIDGEGSYTLSTKGGKHFVSLDASSITPMNSTVKAQEYHAAFNGMDKESANKAKKDASGFDKLLTGSPLFQWRADGAIVGIGQKAAAFHQVKLLRQARREAENALSLDPDSLDNPIIRSKELPKLKAWLESDTAKSKDAADAVAAAKKEVAGQEPQQISAGSMRDGDQVRVNGEWFIASVDDDTQTVTLQDGTTLELWSSDHIEADGGKIIRADGFVETPPDADTSFNEDVDPGKYFQSDKHVVSRPLSEQTLYQAKPSEVHALRLQAIQGIRQLVKNQSGEIKIKTKNAGDLILGYELTTDSGKKTKGGGLLHMVIRRMKQTGEYPEVAADHVINSILHAGINGQWADNHTDNAKLEADGYSLILTKDGTRIVSGFKKGREVGIVASEQALRLIRGYASGDSGSRQQMGAILDSILTRLENKYKPDSQKSQDPASDTADKRGFIDLKRIDGEMQAFINLMPEADESTFLHEFGHLALQTLREMTRGKDAPEPVVKLWNDIAKEFGITGKEITREQHERFARSFEAYLRDGKAPSPELQGAFEIFAEWLMQVYRTIKDLRVKMNPRINALMDRVIASHSIVQHAEAEANAGPMLTPEQMTPEKWAQYQALADQASEEAQRSGRASLLAPLSSDIYAESALRRQIQTEVQEEMMQTPVYQALDALRRAGAGARLNRAAFIERFGEAAMRRLEKHDGRSMFTQGGTGDIDTIAQQFGFGSGEALVYAMNAAPVFEATVKAETRVRLAAKVEPIKANARELAAARKDMIEIVRAEFEARPIYQLIEELTEGVTTEDGSKTKLNTQELRRLYGDPTVRQLPKAIHTADGTLDLDSVSTAHGYPDSAAMIQDIANTPPLESAIEREAQKRLLGDAGDPLSLGDEAIQAASIKALHTDSRGRMIAFELQALRLRAAMPQGRLTGDAAAYLARERIRSLSVKEATAAHKFAKAETRASVQAESHLRRGEIAAAVAAKEMQLIQHHLTREALQAQKDQKSAFGTITREKRSKDPIGIDSEYHGLIRSILAKYGLAKMETKSIWLDNLAGFVDRAGDSEDLEHYSPVMIAQSVINGEAKNWKDLTLGELDDLRQSLDSLRHVGQMRYQLDSVENKAKLAADIATLKAAMTEAFGDNPPGPEGVRSARDAIKRGASVWQSPGGKTIKSLFASITKIEELCDRIDNGNPNGIAHQLFWNKLEAAKNHEADLQTEYTRRIREVIKERGKVDQMQDYFDIPELKNDITPSSSFTREMAIVAALNTGNAGNLRNLLIGRGLSREQLQLLLNKLSAEDWRMVQGIWTTINGFFPGLDTLHREATGVPLAQVEAIPFIVTAVNAKGEQETVELSGGYYPIVHDLDLDKTGRLKELKAPEIAMENTPSPLHPKTANGMMKARNEKAAYPLDLSISGLARHMEQTIHTLTHQKAVLETARTLRDPALNEALDTTAGKEIRELMMPWVQDIARKPENADKNLRGWDRVLSGIRQSVQLFGLGYRLKTILAQFLGFANIAERIGVKWATMGLKLVGTTPEGYDSALSFALEQSAELRNRGNMWERDFRAATDHIATGPESHLQKFQRFAYWGIAEMDKRVSLVAWLGARAKYLSENPGDIDSANRYADGVIRMTQGGNGAMDAAAFMRSRNEWQRMFSLFIGPMNAAWNRLTRLSHDFQVAKRDGKAASVIPALFWRSLWLTAIPAVLQGLLLDRPDKDEEDKDALDWAEWTARKSLAYGVGGVPIARDIVTMATGDSHGGTVTLFDSAYKVAHKAVKAPFDLAQGDIGWQEAALKETDAMAWVFKIPVGQLTLMLDNLRKAGDMDVDPLNPKDLIIRRH